MLDLFVYDANDDKRVPAFVEQATQQDFEKTFDWQTSWLSAAAASMPNKVALRRSDTKELLGLMSYLVDGANLMVEIVYVESAGQKKYIGIARALFAYAVDVSKKAGCDGVLVFKAKTSELVEYYIREFGANRAGSYDPFRLVIWEDAADRIISEFDGRRPENG